MPPPGDGFPHGNMGVVGGGVGRGGRERRNSYNIQKRHKIKVSVYRQSPEEVRHASRNADSACPFFQYKKGHTESAIRDACRTSSGQSLILLGHASIPRTHLLLHWRSLCLSFLIW